MNRNAFLIALLLCTWACAPDRGYAASPTRPVVSGEMKQWHCVTLTMQGPMSSESATPNPFMDFRLQVEFSHAASGLKYSVPGYFAADGDAANTSASEGNQWRCHLSPDHAGEWTYRVSFRKGSNVAVADSSDAGQPVEGMDGLTGQFTIAASDKSGRDLRGKGRLQYVGRHHLRFAGNGEFFLKAGVDAPENLLAYRDLDGDFKTDGVKDNLIKDWTPHVRDWCDGDPTWGDGKGKGLVGAINYLANEGLNVFSFLTLNIDGDDRNVFPYTNYEERYRIDVSRMDQWEVLFSHGERLGMYLHFKTQEAENVNLLDDGELGPQRKLYYRELIARFSHHMALNWNLGEEVGLGHKVSTEKKQAWANFFKEHDPYHHHIVIHNGNNHFDLLGDASPLTGFSLQTNRADFANVHGATLRYLRRSAQAGRPWVVACDEPGDAQHALIPDAENPDHDNARTNALWGNLMAGGAGVEWYFGYKHAHSDLSCQDFRARENMWRQSAIALQFFDQYKVPFWDMTSADNLLGSDPQAYCLAKPGAQYLVYKKQNADALVLDLTGVSGVFDLQWFDPRSGGQLVSGTAPAVRGGGWVMLGNPPTDVDQDWLAVLRPADPQRTYAAGSIVQPMKGDVADRARPSKGGKSGIRLSALGDFSLVNSEDFKGAYKDSARKAWAINAQRFRDQYAAAETSFPGSPGTYDVVLTTLTETDGESSYRFKVGGKLIGTVKNDATAKDYKPQNHRFKNVTLNIDDVLRIEFNSASNGKIPEGDGFAYARGRWTTLTILKPGAPLAKKAPPITSTSSGKQASASGDFQFRYDPKTAKKVHRQTNDLIVVEAEDYDAVDLQKHRKWLLTTENRTPNVKPDPDPNHAAGAVGKAYLELLPDTRVTHADPLVQGVSFAPQPGKCSVLYYPVVFKQPGRYYVWVRMNCTGSEDNG
ncbi:MAG: DUF5060 domain-containing protein, partial [Planctomycetota bacterium]